MKGAESAFWGALFAFIFMWILGLIARFRDRSSRHYTALVKLERAVNEQLSSITDAIRDIDQMVSGLAEAEKDRSTAPMFLNLPEEIAATSDYEHDLVNLDLVNDCFAHHQHVQDASRDLRRLSKAVRDAQEALLAGRLTLDDYFTNLAMLVEWMREVQKHLAALREDGKTLAAKARVRLERDRPVFHRITMPLRRRRHERDFAKAVQAERVVLESEIDRSAEESAKRIEAIQGASGRRGGQD